MAQKPPPIPEELILAEKLLLSMLRDVLARQAEQMRPAPKVGPPSAPPEEPTPPVSPPPVIATPTAMPVATPIAPPKPPALASPPPPIAAPPTVTAKVATPVAEPTAPFPEFEEQEDRLSPAELQELAEFDELATQPLAPGNLPRTLRWVVAGLVVLLILINMPLFDGLTLAGALPDRQSLIIRDGLLLKGSGPEVYVLENNAKRWISSIDAFEHYRYRWDEVHIVDDSFLSQFPDGRPIHVLLKCKESPHIYRLENDRKRWIKDIPTFEAEGHVWEDVRFISCDRLRNIPDGPPIPPDAGPPPQP